MKVGACEVGDGVRVATTGLGVKVEANVAVVEEGMTAKVVVGENGGEVWAGWRIGNCRMQQETRSKRMNIIKKLRCMDIL